MPHGQSRAPGWLINEEPADYVGAKSSRGPLHSENAKSRVVRQTQLPRLQG